MICSSRAATRGGVSADSDRLNNHGSPERVRTTPYHAVSTLMVTSICPLIPFLNLSPVQNANHKTLLFYLKQVCINISTHLIWTLTSQSESHLGFVYIVAGDPISHGPRGDAPI